MGCVAVNFVVGAVCRLIPDHPLAASDWSTVVAAVAVAAAHEEASKEWHTMVYM